MCPGAAVSAPAVSNQFFQLLREYVMGLLIEKLDAMETFTHDALEKVFLAVMEATGLKLGKIAQPVRMALTGSTVSPGIFEIIEVLGKEETVKRLRAAVAYIEGAE